VIDCSGYSYHVSGQAGEIQGSDPRSVLVIMIVQPDTVVRWHKKAFRMYWRCKSQQGKRGRPSIDPDIKMLVIKMANANPLWGAPKIHGELLKPGIEISERTVSGLLGRHPRKSSSQTWRTFIRNHMKDMVAVDFPR